MKWIDGDGNDIVANPSAPEPVRCSAGRRQNMGRRLRGQLAPGRGRRHGDGGRGRGANAIDVLANDTAAPDTGETLTVTAVTQGANGTVASRAAAPA